ncbi:hypothetical protein [Nonomuraea longicatena]|uniref:Uncharacterized protein n=1 Tax=Nonomuraea longicatena TaxID=83682 RepID=A0ABP3ZEH0_9ACTN
MTNLVFLDVKTTSLDDQIGHLWEIGLAFREPGSPDSEHWWQIKPDLTGAAPGSLTISRYYKRCRVTRGSVGRAVELATRDDESGDDDRLSRKQGDVLDWTDAPMVAAELAAFLDGAYVVGINPALAQRFCRRFLARNGQCWTANNLIDVQALALGFLYGNIGYSVMIKPGVPWRSRDLYSAFVDLNRYDSHTALDDARMARDIFDAVTGSKPQ